VFRSVRNISSARGRGASGVTSVLLTTLAALGAVAVAVAAKPKPGAHFVGKVASGKVNGFSAPVTFTVSQNGRLLTSFRYSSFGCFGAGGFRPGIDYYTQPGAIIKVGVVKSSASGHFSATGAVSSYTVAGSTTKTTSSVVGSFTTSRAAKGVITISQVSSGKYNAKCGPGTLAFTATAH
jgi:hypothetical protein